MRFRLPPTWKSNKFRLIFIPVVCAKRLGYLTCRAVMPSEKFERVLVLKHINKMETDIPQNNSRAELVHSNEESTETSPSERTIRDVKIREWIMVFILCFVNLINYMDRFTLAGILQDIQTYFDVHNGKGGLLQTAFVLSYMIFAPIFGYLGDRYSRKNIMAFGVFLWSITTLIGSFMTNYWLFLLFRALVGIGEASYSTIAPTIISDLFVGDVRSKMLALFYFAIPVGSGMGYIVGSETAKAAGKWQWGLRVTPALGVIAVILIFFILRDPERGQSEGSSHIQTTPWTEDLKDLAKNKSFIFSTAAFTCVTFVAGALAWWGPNFIEKGLKLQMGENNVDSDSSTFIFGAITILAGLVGLTLGCYLSQKLKPKYPRVDPIICAVGLLISAPLLLGTTFAATYNIALCYVLLFLGQVALNLNWSIVSDILLYVVLPTRRSTAEGLQLLVSHALGDAGSPYLIGVMSEAILNLLNKSSKNEWNDFKSLQYALFTTCFVEILGALFFLVNALYILHDKQKVEKAIQEVMDSGSSARGQLVSIETAHSQIPNNS
ncbi:protein spinster-like isoform X2 [Zophobas morio]|uniref:protein spinster-like isoform X2 n=1 Tax=Zophobas morio TaxID=2755281 RepID=UPI0030834492